MPANTKAATSAEITTQIEFLRADLSKVNATIELIGKPAITKAEQLVKAITAANEQLAVALANEAEAERQARLAGFGNITVTVAYPSNYEGNLLRAIFTVEYTRLQYNMAFRAPKRDYNAPPWPQSLDALRSGCGEHGELVAAHAAAIAARGWACDRLTADGLIQPGKASGNPAAIVRTSLDLHIHQLWADAGAGELWAKYGNPALRDLSPASRQEAMLVVEETIAEWEAAGCPSLDHAALYAAYRYLCGHVWAGQLTPFPRCLEAPPGMAEPIKLKEGNE